VRKETFLTFRRIKREKKQNGCKQGFTTTLITGESTGKLPFKCPSAVPCHHSGRYLPISMQSAAKVKKLV